MQAAETLPEVLVRELGPNGLQRAMAFAESLLPRLAEDIVAELVLEGIADRPSALEALLAAVTLVGRDAAFELVSLGGIQVAMPKGCTERIIGWVMDAAAEAMHEYAAASVEKITTVVEEEHGELLDEGVVRAVLGLRSDVHWLQAEEGTFWFAAGNPAIEAAYDVTSRLGVGPLDEVAELARSRLAASPSSEVIQQLVAAEAGFSWLDEERSWFSLRSDGASRSQMEAQLRKALAVARRVRSNELRSALRRVSLGSGLFPPAAVLAEFCQQMLGCEADGEDIIAPETLIVSDSLTIPEQKLLAILTAGEGVPWSRLVESGETCGLSESSLRGLVNVSAFVVRRPGNRLTVLGTPSAGEGRLAEAEERPEPTQAGMLRRHLVWRLTDETLRSGVIDIPEGVELEPRTLRLRTTDGTRVGTLGVSGGIASGLEKFLRRAGAEPGDYLVLELDANNDAATIWLGDWTLVGL